MTNRLRLHQRNGEVICVVDLSEKEMFDNDIEVAFGEKPDIKKYESIIKEQQRFIKSLVTENLQLREKILDMVMN